MDGWSNYSFQYAGKKYAFTARLISKVNGVDRQLVLNNDCLTEFRYSNALNGCYLTGRLVYVDRKGEVDWYIDKQYAYLYVQCCQIKMQTDGGVYTETPSETDKFDLMFMVNSIKILERKDHVIQYQINLLSDNWGKCQGIIEFSNYGRQKETVFQLIKQMFQINGMNVDAQGFDMMDSLYRMHYITNGCDNTVTSVKYLLHKLYYYDVKEMQQKFFVYNEQKNLYQPFDITKLDTAAGVYSIVLSFFKTNTEELFNPQQSNFSVIVEMPKSKALRQTFDKIFYDYSLNTNGIIDKTITSKEIAAYRNNRIANDAQNYDDKFKALQPDGLQKNRLRAAYWNNEYDVYGDFYRELMQDNSLVIWTTGEILRRPGSLVAVNVDRNIKFANSNQLQSIDDVTNKYRFFEGLWIVGKVTHIISPVSKTYTQNLLLFKNYSSKFYEKK